MVPKNSKKVPQDEDHIGRNSRNDEHFEWMDRIGSITEDLDDDLKAPAAHAASRSRSILGVGFSYFICTVGILSMISFGAYVAVLSAVSVCMYSAARFTRRKAAASSSGVVSPTMAVLPTTTIVNEIHAMGSYKEDLEVPSNAPLPFDAERGIYS